METDDSGRDLVIEVIHATPGTIWRRTVTLAPGTTVAQALQASGFAQSFPEYPLATPCVGVFGQACGLERILEAGDRVEIYRPLVFDPKESRRRRAAHREAARVRPRGEPRKRNKKVV